METNITRLRELTIRYSVKRDDNGQPLTLGRTLSAPRESAELLVTLLQNEPAEVFAILCLTTKHQLIAYHEVSRGQLDATIVHPREVFKAAILANAAAIILAHSVARNIMRLMCRRSLCGRGQWKPPITPVDTLIAGT
jgi:DNA repair protein RadC